MANYFMPIVTLHLKDENDLRQALDNPEWMTWKHPGSWQVRSDSIIGIIDEIEAEGKYPYNTDVQRRVETRLGIPRQDDNGSPLSRLVYNAQGFRRSDRRIHAGFEPCTQDVIDRAGEGGQIQLEGETLLGGTGYATYNVRNIQGKLYAMLPKKRKYALAIQGQPVKITKYAPSTGV